MSNLPNERVRKLAEQMVTAMTARPYSSAEYAIACGTIRGITSPVNTYTDAERLALVAEVFAALDTAQAQFDRQDRSHDGRPRHWSWH